MKNEIKIIRKKLDHKPTIKDIQKIIKESNIIFQKQIEEENKRKIIHDKIKNKIREETEGEETFIKDTITTIFQITSLEETLEELIEKMSKERKKYHEIETKEIKNLRNIIERTNNYIKTIILTKLI